MDSEAFASMPLYTLPQILSRQADRLGSEKVALREKSAGYGKNTLGGISNVCKIHGSRHDLLRA